MNTTTTRTFEFIDDKSSKFWEVTQFGSTVTVRYGKKGANGNMQQKVFDDASAASRYITKLISEKIGKGYFEVGSTPSATLIKRVPPNEDITTEGVITPTARTKVSKSADAKWRDLKNSAKDPEATPESLLELYDKDDSTNRLLAKHPRANAELLEKLSHSSDKATRRAVCANPNVSVEVLMLLAPQFPAEFYKNQLFDWLLIDDLNLFSKLGKGVFKNILKQSDCPLSFLEWASSHGDEDELLAVAMNPKATNEMLGRLVLNGGRVADAANGRLTQENSKNINLDKIFKDEVLKSLQSLDGITKNHLNLLYYRHLIDVRSCTYFNAMKWRSKSENNKIKNNLIKVLANLNNEDENLMNAEIVNIFCKSKSRGLNIIGLSNKNADIELLIRHCKSIDWVVRFAISRNQTTPINILTALKNDVHRLVAQQAHKTLEFKSQIRDRHERTIKENEEAINFRPIADEIIKELHRADTWSSAVVGTRWWRYLRVSDRIGWIYDFSHNGVISAFKENFLINSGVDIDVLIESPDPWVRGVACLSPDIKSDHLVKLLNDDDLSVSSAAAMHRNLPISVLKSFANDINFKVHLSIIRNPKLPVHLLNKFAASLDENIRSAAAKNEMLNIDLLNKLSDDKDRFVRSSVASNVNCPPHLLIKLAKDKDDYVRRRVAQNKKTPINIMESLMFDKDAYVRGGLAVNIQTPDFILAHLSKDREALVREQVAIHPNIKLELLKDLSNDDDFRVKIGVLYNRNTTQALAEIMLSNLSKISKVKKDDLGGFRVYYHTINDEIIRFKAGNTSTNTEELTRLANIGLWSIRLTAINNPSFPSSLKQQALADLHCEMEQAIMLDYKKQKFEDQDIADIPSVLQSIRFLGPKNLFNYKIAAAVAKSDDVLKKFSLIMTTDIQPGILSILMDDGNEFVRQLAIKKSREIRQG